MEKYQKLFLERMSKPLNQWKEKEAIEEKSIYQFLHTIKGTAASIGLDDFSKEAEAKIEGVDPASLKRWSLEEWQEYLHFFQPVKQEENTIILKNHIDKLNENEKLLLLIDDDITILNFMKENLEKAGFMVLAAVTGEKALTLFYDHKPDCILLDIHLPDQTGFEVLETILEKSHSYFIPIILLSSDNSKATRIRGYEKGAVDFIAKPFDIDELLARVNNRIKFKELVSDAVLIDELTGAFNRKFFKMEMDRYLKEFSRSKDVFSLVVLDLDHFKKVNDQYGHLVGDQVLKGFASFIMSNKRSADYLVRFGGEEFILLLPHTTKDEAKLFVNRLLKDFGATQFYSEENQPFSVTFSAGVVEIVDPTIHVEEYLKRADQALYFAKEHGRNQVSLYEDMNTLVSTKVVRIAVIDDDAVVHELVKDRLANLSFGNYQVDFQSFREGESFFASDWHKQSGKTLILLDGIMPRMDGLEVLRKLRKDYSETKFTVLMLTGRKSEKDVVKALELGADDYLTKPFSIAELEARVKRLVKRMMV